MSAGRGGESVRLPKGEIDQELIDRCAGVVASGGVILYPTDTIYGLGCDALDSGAVRRVYEIKRRPDTMPMIVLIGSVEAAVALAAGVGVRARELMRALWPGPLTVLLRANARLYPWLSAGSGKIGLRFPNHEFSVRLMEASMRPLLSTSANLSGEEYVGSVETLTTLFGGEVDLFVDAGALPESMPSTIIDATDDTLVVVREGAVPVASLKRFFA